LYGGWILSSGQFELKNGNLFVLAEAAGGVYNGSQLRLICDVADDVSVFLKVTEDQRIGFMVPKEKLLELHAKLSKSGILLKHYRNHSILSPKACLGELCSKCEQDALGDAIEISPMLNEKFKESFQALNIGMNGCATACVASATDDIHVIGEKSGYRLFIGGRISDKPKLAEYVAEGIPRPKIGEAISIMLDTYSQNKQENESLADVVARIGLNTFKESILKAGLSNSNEEAPHTEETKASESEELTEDTAAVPLTESPLEEPLSKQNKEIPPPAEEAIASDAPPADEAIASDAPPADEAIASDAPPADEAIASDAPSADEAIASYAPPADEAIASDAPSADEAIASDAPSADEAIASDTPPPEEEAPLEVAAVEATPSEIKPEEPPLEVAGAETAPTETAAIEEAPLEVGEDAPPAEEAPLEVAGAEEVPKEDESVTEEISPSSDEAVATDPVEGEIPVGEEAMKEEEIAIAEEPAVEAAGSEPPAEAPSEEKPSVEVKDLDIVDDTAATEAPPPAEAVADTPAEEAAPGGEESTPEPIDHGLGEDTSIKAGEIPPPAEEGINEDSTAPIGLDEDVKSENVSSGNKISIQVRGKYFMVILSDGSDFRIPFKTIADGKTFEMQIEDETFIIENSNGKMQIKYGDVEMHVPLNHASASESDESEGAA
jgi:dissimilatory sulfite reductase (desulfoviridin) alpha/beta subunit